MKDGKYILSNGAVVSARSKIGEGSVIGEGSKIGAGSVIGARSVIGEWSVIGARSVIGEGSVIGARSKIGEGSKIGGGSVIGGGSTILCFSTLENWYVTIWQDQRDDHGLMMRIGCQEHTVSRWRGFSDVLITKMDTRALDWWKAYGAVLLGMADALGALEAVKTATREEAKSDS
ncbi:hypothetical protein [Armatimonas sp.]|uniref:hypothetical protein n=1 Tax=Armatimonas sp. TaxID=1872638 RepID=UPI003751CB89